MAIRRVKKVVESKDNVEENVVTAEDVAIDSSINNDNERKQEGNDPKSNQLALTQKELVKTFSKRKPFSVRNPAAEDFLATLSTNDDSVGDNNHRSNKSSNNHGNNNNPTTSKKLINERKSNMETSSVSSTRTSERRSQQTQRFVPGSKIAAIEGKAKVEEVATKKRGNEDVLDSEKEEEEVEKEAVVEKKEERQTSYKKTKN